MEVKKDVTAEFEGKTILLQKGGVPIINPTNNKYIAKAMAGELLALNIFGVDSQKKKTLKRIKKELRVWVRHYETLVSFFESTIKANVKNNRARQEADQLFVALQDIICNVCMKQKPDSVDKESLQRACQLVDMLRDMVGWNIYPEIEEDEPAEEPKQEDEDADPSGGQGKTDSQD